MATFNLVRNSRVFYTTNVDPSTGVVAATGFTTANTQELQVLDGFTFGQTSNADTITISEAGSTPVRGQRSFNTSLGQADFSFSTYLRPYKATTVKCEESVLWNSLMGSVALDSASAIALDLSSATSTPSAVSWTAAVGTTPGFLTFTTTSTTGLVDGEVVMVTGHALKDRNVAMRIQLGDSTGADTATKFRGTWISNPATVATEVFGNWENVILRRTAWNAQTGGTGLTAASTDAWAAYSEVSTALSNKNQLVKFGMVMVVDGITYVINNCCMNQAVVDFGLDGIAMAAWTGMGTELKQLAYQLVFDSASPFGITRSDTSAPVGNYTYKNTTAEFITNKLSTISLKAGINGTTSGALGGTAGNEYKLALTGGSITVNNNVTYVTPANLGVVNLPVGYYTGTRAISGSVTAYLRTGALNTAGLLNALLTASATSAGVEPKYQLMISIGGASASTRVEVELPMAFLQIPTIDAAAVMSTTINFTAEGHSTDASGTGIDIESTNELEIRYIKA